MLSLTQQQRRERADSILTVYGGLPGALLLIAAEVCDRWDAWYHEGYIEEE